MSKMGWQKFIFAIVLVIAVSASLWFAAPVRALTVDITDPSPKLLGQTISFQVVVTIEDGELLPIQGVNLYIYKSDSPAAYKATCANLPLGFGTNVYTDTDTGGGGVVTVTAVPTGWGYNEGYGYAVWEGTAYNFSYGYGYGGAASITYNVSWVSPAGWPAGEYTIDTVITADSTTFTETRTVVLSRPVIGGGGGAGGVDRTPPRISNVSICAIGNTTADICWNTQEKSNSQVEYRSSPSMFSELDEAMVLDHCVSLTGLIPGTTYFYKTMSQDKAGNLAVSDEQTFTTLGEPPAFVVKSLEITPTEADIGQQVAISVIVANTGDASGTYEVTLKVDNVVVATKQVTIAGGAEEKVTFSITQDAAKTYSVNVNGLSGSLVVEAATPPPPTPTPTPTPPAPTPPAKPINWWLIGGIIIAVIIAGTVVWLTVVRQKA